MTTKPEIDVYRTKQLRRCGLSWREVGIRLAWEMGREPVFHGASVNQAVNIADGKRKTSREYRTKGAA